MRDLATALPFIVQWGLRGQSTNSIVWLCLHRMMRCTVPGGQIAADWRAPRNDWLRSSATEDARKRTSAMSSFSTERALTHLWTVA